MVLAMLVAGAATGVACGGDDEPAGPNGNGSDGTMTARINSAFWSGDLTVSVEFSSNTLTLTGRDNNFQEIRLDVASVSGTGTFQVGAGAASVGTLTIGSSDVWLASSAGGSGTVFITTLTATRAAGTFSFLGVPKVGSTAVGKGNRTVTEGTFDVTLN
jgi:hypothetical protein